MKDLLPCPFCGGRAELRGHHAPEFWVSCPAIGCKASTEAFGSKDKAIAAWNRRSAPVQAPVAPVDMVEALRRLLAWVKLEFKDRTVPEPWAKAIAKAEKALALAGDSQ